MSYSHQLAVGKILRRIPLFVGLTAIVFATLLPSVDAAQSKHKSVKVTKNTIVAKRKNTKTFGAVKRKSAIHAAVVPMKPSFGQIAGLHGTHDSLDLKSSVALVINAVMIICVLMATSVNIFLIQSIYARQALWSGAPAPTPHVRDIEENWVKGCWHHLNAIRLSPLLR